MSNEKEGGFQPPQAVPGDPPLGGTSGHIPSIFGPMGDLALHLKQEYNKVKGELDVANGALREARKFFTEHPWGLRARGVDYEQWWEEVPLLAHLLEKWREQASELQTPDAQMYEHADFDDVDEEVTNSVWQKAHEEMMADIARQIRHAGYYFAEMKLGEGPYWIARAWKPGRGIRETCSCHRFNAVAQLVSDLGIEVSTEFRERVTAPRPGVATSMMLPHDQDWWKSPSHPRYNRVDLSEDVVK